MIRPVITSTEQSLHSNMVLLIPLKELSYDDTAYFTFQYGSINTKLMRIDLTTEKIFTFQYGSINT